MIFRSVILMGSAAALVCLDITGYVGHQIVMMGPNQYHELKVSTEEIRVSQSAR